MKNISIILPVHRLDKGYSSMLENALLSTQNFHNDVKILIVCPIKMEEEMKSIDFGQKMDIEIIYNNSGKYDFISQVNLGIDRCETEWFSILEIDDEYQPIWLTSMNEYMVNFKDVDVFLPLVKDINTEGEFTNYTNESVWAYGFSKEQGVLDNEVLLDFQSYQTSGGLYRTKTVMEMGKFKDNIKLTFSYEFLLRLTHHGVKIMVVPRVGYRHVNFREDSLFWLYKNTDDMKEDEAKFWLETAKKEYFFKNKREIEYKQ